MATKMGHDQFLALGLFEKEASYDAGTNMTATEATGMNNFTLGLEWSDEVVNDLEEVTGSEFATEQTLVEQRVKATYGEPNCKPSTLAGMAALVLGTTAATKDGAFDAYQHKSVPAAVAADLPSIQMEHKIGGVQYAYKGVKGNSLKLSGEPGGFLALEAELMGSGTRAISATAIAADISESWMKLNNALIWMENGAAISIAAAPVQGVENISSGAPDDIKTTIKTFEIGISNNLEEIPGFGGAGVLQDLQMGRRDVTLAFTLRFSGQADIDRFINQEAHAIELNLSGALIDAGGAYKYGADIIIAMFKITKAGIPQAGPGDSLEVPFECQVMDDGTNDVIEIITYNAQVAYLT